MWAKSPQVSGNVSLYYSTETGFNWTKIQTVDINNRSYTWDWYKNSNLLNKDFFVKIQSDYNSDIQDQTYCKVTWIPQWSYRINYISVGYSYIHHLQDSTYNKNFVFNGPNRKFGIFKLGIGAVYGKSKFPFYGGVYIPLGSLAGYADYYPLKDEQMVEFGITINKEFPELKIGYRQFYNKDFSEEIFTNISGLHATLYFGISTLLLKERY